MIMSNMQGNLTVGTTTVGIATLFESSRRSPSDGPQF